MGKQKLTPKSCFWKRLLSRIVLYKIISDPLGWLPTPLCKTYMADRPVLEIFVSLPFTVFISYCLLIGDYMVAFTSGDDFATFTVPIAATLSSSICVRYNVLWKCSVKCSQMSGCAVNCLPHSVSKVVTVCRLLFSASVRWKKELCCVH